VHSYVSPGSYNWSVTTSVTDGSTTVTTNLTGTVVVGGPVFLTARATGNAIQLTWPLTTADALVEESPSLAPDAQWTVAPDVVVEDGGTLSITVSNSASRFFRLRKL